jgi:hypothetical protein
MMSPSTRTQVSTCHLLPPDTPIDAPGAGEPFELGPLAAKRILLVLRITEIIEQEALDVSVWSSPDGKDWGVGPLFAYPQKFYRGLTPAALDLRQKPEIKFLQARWDVNRWGRGYPRPYFKFGLEIQELD